MDNTETVANTLAEPTVQEVKVESAPAQSDFKAEAPAQSETRVETPVQAEVQVQAEAPAQVEAPVQAEAPATPGTDAAMFEELLNNE